MKYIFLCSLFALSVSLSAQTVTGTIKNDQGEYLFGATVKWDGSETGAIADINGYFALPQQDTVALLQIEYVGYEPLYIEVTPEETNLDIELNGIYDLMTVEVAAKRYDNYTSTIEVLNLETIGAGELRKAACCNLSETFNTNVSVDVAYSDAVTGAKEIMMLGLRGTYTQMTVEKRPAMVGLGSPFAMEYLPGTWLNSIQISKGTGSVQNGYQAIAGQINTEIVKPFEDHPLFVNLYGSTFGRGEANLHLNHIFNDKISAGLLLHGSTRKNQLDANEDTFYDTPQKEMLDGMFRLFYRGDLIRAQFNVHALMDRHEAGQIIPKGENPANYYQIAQDHDRVELFGKVGYLGFKDPSQSLGFITNASWHQMDAYYGTRTHRGEQKNFYSNPMFATDLTNADHQLITGFSYQYDDYREQLNDADFGRLESVPGIFVEYTFDHVHAPGEATEEDAEKNKYNLREAFGATVGLRVDHNSLFGWLVTPRANLSYNFSDNSIIRWSVGRGFRTANVVAENIGMLASSRVVKITETLDMEEAWNTGINYTQNFTLGGRTGSFSADLFRTNFVNQVVMDMDAAIDAVFFYNLDGKSYSNSLITVLSYEVVRGLNVKVGYKFNDVQITFQDGETRAKPLVAKHRGLISIDYVTPNEKWDFNVNTQLVGRSRFAHVTENPFHNEEQHLGETRPFALANAHLNYKVKDNFEIYIGGENLTGFTQEDPILDWQNPFGDYFDATHIYAPVTGAMGYLGLRFWLDR